MRGSKPIEVGVKGRHAVGSRPRSRLTTSLLLFYLAFCLLPPLPAEAGGFVAWRQNNQEDFLTGSFSGTSASLSAGDVVLSKGEQRTTLTVTLPKVVSHASAVWDVVRNVAYIFGGLDQDESVVADIVRFDPASGQATLMGVSLPSGRATTSAVWDNTANVAYIFGGSDNLSSMATIVRFDPSTNTVSTIAATLPFARELTSAVWDTTNRVAYVFGGMSDLTLISQIVKFDPNAGTPISVSTSSLPSARRYTSAVWDTSRSVAYVMGGFLGGTYSDQMIRFNPSTNQVESLSAVLPSPRQAMSAVWDDGQNVAYIFGGLNNGGLLSGIAKWDPTTGSMATLEITLPSARNDAMAVWDSTNKIAYVLAGVGADRLNDIAQFGLGFQSSGTYSSSPKNRLDDSAGAWSTIAWNPMTQTSGTTLRVQTASSKNSSGPWEYVGPDGSAGSYYTNPTGTAIWTGQVADTYLRYRAIMFSTSALLSPTLGDLVISYSSSLSLSAQPTSNQSRVKPGDRVMMAGTVPLFSANPTVAVVLKDEYGQVISDGVNGHSLSVSADGTVSGSVELGSLRLKRGNATKMMIEVTVTESSGRSSVLSSAMMTLEGSESSVKAFNNRIKPLNGDQATVRVEIARAGRVSIRIYTIDGELVHTLEDSDQPSGIHTWEWGGRNGHGELVATGVYVVHVTGPDLSATQKIAVIK